MFLTSARGGGVRWRTVCVIPAHCPRILFFLGFGQIAAKLGVCKNPTLTGSLSVKIIIVIVV